MRNLFRFIKVYHFALLFILIESFSLFLYISNHKFQQSKFLSFTQEYTGAIYSYYSDINEYFDLKKENNYLKQENAKLLSILSKEENNQNPELFNYISATIIKNSIYKEDNYLLLNKGEKDGVRSNMGVVTENGVIGIISTTSKNYSKAISILNQTSSISILHLKSNQNGSLIWTGNDYRTAEINDIPNHADLLVGDTIVTNGFSSIFPEGIKIATIKTFEKGNENGLYSIKVNFINDMNTSKHVYIINSLNKPERDRL